MSLCVLLNAVGYAGRILRGRLFVKTVYFGGQDYSARVELLH